jgi:hypothetical protein
MPAISIGKGFDLYNFYLRYVRNMSWFRLGIVDIL